MDAYVVAKVRGAAQLLLGCNFLTKVLMVESGSSSLFQFVSIVLVGEILGIVLDEWVDKPLET